MIHRPDSVPVIVVAGYLGSGKTTLINELLVHTSRKVAVVVNDFGSVNIDASLIASVNSDTIELTNGCICCALGATLADTMLTIGDRDILPDLVVIEASGVSDPSAVAANAYIDGFHLGATVVLIDAVNSAHTFHNELVGQTFLRQINNAHVLVMTKTDVATTEQLASCRAITETVMAPVIDRAHFDLESLIDAMHTPPTSPPSSNHNDNYSSEVLEVPNLTSVKELEALLAQLPPQVIRAKGIVQIDEKNYLVQRVGTHTAITTTDIAPTGIVVIYAD